MKSEHIFKAIRNVDDVLLIRTEKALKSKKKSFYWPKWGATAASVCFVVISAFAFKFYNTAVNKMNVPGASGEIVDSFHSSTVSGIYDAPGNGEILTFSEVKEALKANEGKDTLYFVSIDIYSDKQILEPDSAEVKNETERLRGLGLKVGYATQWTYQGDLDRMDITYVAGYFTADQLNNFPASEHYGYAFSFATNGDGSAVDSEQGLNAEP